jgi:predicted MFS family arabinose efflux permease
MSAVEGRSTTSAWGAVICMALLAFLLVASEFMPVSLLTPIASGLGITEGQAGQAISVSGFFAVIASFFGNSLLHRLDRRVVVLGYTALLVVSGIAIISAPNYLLFMFGRALLGIAIGGFWSLSTAILARIVTLAELPKAIALLQGGTAFAAVIAAPFGSFLGRSAWRPLSGNCSCCPRCRPMARFRSGGCFHCSRAASSLSAWWGRPWHSWASLHSRPTSDLSSRA